MKDSIFDRIAMLFGKPWAELGPEECREILARLREALEEVRDA